MNEQEVIELLPEYVNGSLDEERRAWVESAAASSHRIQKEIALLKIIRSEVKNEVISSSPDWGWRQLEKNIRLKEENVGSTDNINKSTVWRNWAVAASLVVCFQSAYLVSTSFESNSNFVPLSTSGKENALDVRFANQISEADMRRIIMNTGGSIVGGPSALGMYQIEYSDIDAALKMLKDSPLVDYAAFSNDG